jgi:hypothetical protein
MGLTLNTTFFQPYLYQNHKGTMVGTVVKQRTRNDVIYCPTDDWHRISETGALDTDPILIGYFSLPGRTDNDWPYDSAGLCGMALPKETRRTLSPGADHERPVAGGRHMEYNRK